jgi:hypothetical protein
MKRFVVVAALAALSACASFKTVVAPPDDLEDYRAYRVAAYRGTRLARAQTYLERHPEGSFAEEVRAAFEDEEPRYFADAQESREGVRRYLADLPRGPHADAAIAMLIALGSNMQDAELADLARKVRFEDSKLESAAVQRRAVAETILGAVGVLLDESVYGIPRDDGPPALKKLMFGTAPPTWGRPPARREEDLFFLLPTRPERDSRLLTVVIALEESEGVVVGGRISGSDMFVRWAEADQIVKLDPEAPDDRAEAHVHAQSRLEGALERRFPRAACPDRAQGRELFHRACDGWEAVVVPGVRAGDDDAIAIRGRRGPAPR